jgi:DNA-binding response OmpR family regulator
MCQRCPVLEEENAWLRSELGLRVEATHLDAITRALRVEPNQARLLLALYTARGRVVLRDQLRDVLALRPEAMDADRDYRNFISVHICRLRKSFSGIRTALGLGYAMTPAGMAQVRALIEAAA